MKKDYLNNYRIIMSRTFGVVRFLNSKAYKHRSKIGEYICLDKDH